MAASRARNSGDAPRVAPPMPASEKKRKTPALGNARDFGEALFGGDFHARRRAVAVQRRRGRRLQEPVTTWTTKARKPRSPPVAPKRERRSNA